MKAIREIEEPLLERKKIFLELDYDKGPTPSEATVKKECAEKLKINEDLIVVRHIYSKYGFSKGEVIIDVYNNKESFDRFEKINKKKKEKKEKVENAKEEKGKEQKAK